MKTNTITEAIPKSLEENYATARGTGPAKRPGQIYRRVLVGTDFTPASEPAFEHALRIAKHNQAELLIAHVDELPGTISFMPPECYDEWITSCRTKAEKQIRALADRAHKEGVHCHALVLIGPPDDALVDAAQKLKVDLIVTGTHGRRGISRFFEGSVASSVMSHAQCSVLTVHSAASKSKLN